MDIICRICQQSEVEELIPISCREATHLKRICDLISAVTSLSVEEFDRLPQHVCSECFWQLARAYRLWELCRGAVRRKGLLQNQQNDHRCRICCVLIEGKPCRKWDMDIGDMVQYLTGAFIEIDDISHSWFVCTNCLLEMDAAYEFKSKCIGSEATFLKTMSFVWERMEVDPCNPEHLVMDLYAEALQEQDVLGRVHCSVCLLDVAMQQLGKKCEGCKLQFRNYDEIRSVQASLCAEENIRTSPDEIDSVWIEEILSQEFVDDELEEKYLIEDDIMFETNTEVENISQTFINDEQDKDSLIEVDDTNSEADNDNHAEPTEPSYKVYNDDSQIGYEIFERYPDDPFPKARPTGPVCCKCMKFFDTSFVLEKHMHSRHKKPTGRGEFACNECLSLFTDQQSLVLHKVKLRTFFYDYCKSCQILLSTPSLLLQHKLKFHPEIETVLEAVPNKKATSKWVCASVHKNSTTAAEESCPNAHSNKSTVTNQSVTNKSVSVDKNSTTATEGSCPTEHNMNNNMPTRTKGPLQLKHSNVVINKSVSVDKNSTTATEESCPTAHNNRSTRINQPLVLKHSSVVTNKSVSVGKNSTTATEGSYSKEVETKFKTEIFVTYDCCLQNCNNRFPSEEQLLNHFNTAHYQSELELLENVCQYCTESFPNETALRDHCNRKVERKSYSCLIDGCHFRDTVEFWMIQHCSQKPHVKLINKSNEKPASLIKRGPLDLKHFTVVGKLDDNTDIVERKGELCCRCFRLFDSKEELTTHCQQHGTIEGQPFQCPLCGRGFLRKSAYTGHKNITENRVHYFCRVCEKILWTKFYYKCHRAVHLTDDTNSTTAIEESSPMDVENNFKPEIFVTYDCCVTKCYNRYSSEVLLLKHFKAAHDQPEQLLGHSCQYCKENFPDETALLEHSNRKVERTMYRCLIDDCGFTRSIKSFMIQHCSQKPHVKSINEDYETPLAVIKKRPLDLKHFSVVRKVDDNTDILKRKGELCCMCFLLFDSKEELTAHCEQHSSNKGEKPFHCLVCGRGFATNAAYLYHKKLTENPLHYFCRVCEKMLWTKHDYITHRAKLHFPDDENVPIETMLDDSFVCCGCKEQFETEAELVEHRREKHPPPLASSSKPLRKEPKCDYCHSYYTAIWKLEKHIALYENKKIYKCKLPSCGFSSKDLQQIRRHILGAQHQDSLRTTIFHTDPSEHLCCFMDCEFKCHDYDTMIKHGTEMHAQTREHFSIAHRHCKFKCQVCGKGFKREKALVNHKSHRQACDCGGCKKKSTKCEICDKVLASISSLRNHVEVMHSNERKKRDKEVCNICGKTYNNLSTHMENHKNERKWECKICAMRFNHIHLLRSHHRVHTNEKNYACRYGCEKRYKGPGDRDRHEKLVHLGITPFRCEICEASFVRMRDLQLHQRKHTGLKLYSCSHCYADFNKKSEYDDHCKQCQTS